VRCVFISLKMLIFFSLFDIIYKVLQTQSVGTYNFQNKYVFTNYKFKIYSCHNNSKLKEGKDSLRDI
jgi:hypothetical protein